MTGSGNSLEWECWERLAGLGYGFKFSLTPEFGWMLKHFGVFSIRAKGTSVSSLSVGKRLPETERQQVKV